MNKTKKYTLIFIVLCFIFIGGAGIYHTCFVPNQEEKEVVEIKEVLGFDEGKYIIREVKE